MHDVRLGAAASDRRLARLVRGLNPQPGRSLDLEGQVEYQPGPQLGSASSESEAAGRATVSRRHSTRTKEARQRLRAQRAPSTPPVFLRPLVVSPRSRVVVSAVDAPVM